MYIDARDVFNRRDAVLGPFRWQDSVKQVNEDGSVIVALSSNPPTTVQPESPVRKTDPAAVEPARFARLPISAT